MLRKLLLSFGLLLIAMPVAAQQPAAEAVAEELPPALNEYMGRKIAQTMHYAGAPWLVRESRQREEDCQKMLAALGVKPGMAVCDLGCGNGFYTLQLAKLVGEDGKVFAVDIQSEMLSLMEKRAKPGELDNVKLVLGTLIDPELEKSSCDLILLVDVYHEFSHPVHMLSKIREALKPDGRVVLVEFRLEDPQVPIKLLHKMSKEQMNRELTANGFKLAQEYDDLPWQHMMFYGRDEQWQPEESGED
jgi:ubiquinone/menaquinone biosynthesis C-methylase UbiE